MNKSLKPSPSASETEEMESNQELPTSHFQYRLKGVVVHTGSADSGHYYSFIEGANAQWYEFNDERVSEFDK